MVHNLIQVDEGSETSTSDFICGAIYSILTKTGKSIVHGYCPQITVNQMVKLWKLKPAKEKEPC